MISYNTSAYKLSDIPPGFFKHIIKDGDDTITVHAFKTSNTNPTLIECIKAFFGFDRKMRYRVTLWNNDKIIAFTDSNPDIWENADVKKINGVIERLKKARDKMA